VMDCPAGMGRRQETHAYGGQLDYSDGVEAGAMWAGISSTNMMIASSWLSV
jgi:hypothetical protein